MVFDLPSLQRAIRDTRDFVLDRVRAGIHPNDLAKLTEKQLFDEVAAFVMAKKPIVQTISVIPPFPRKP